MSTYIRSGSGLLASLLLAGCTHTVFVHEPPEGGFQIERPRYPLNAALALEGTAQNNATVQTLLERSGYFSNLYAGKSAPAGTQVDLEIAYKGVDCGSAESASDTFLGHWGYTAMMVVVTLPTLGVVPPGANSETPCQQVFAYRFRAPRSGQPRSVAYPFRIVEYSTTAPGLYASDEKRKFQREYLLDQSVAALLSDIASQLGKN